METGGGGGGVWGGITRRRRRRRKWGGIGGGGGGSGCMCIFMSMCMLRCVKAVRARFWAISNALVISIFEHFSLCFRQGRVIYQNLYLTF